MKTKEGVSNTGQEADRSETPASGTSVSDWYDGFADVQIAHGIAPTDTESLNEHRESTEKAVEFRMKALELRVDYEKALAEYQSALGEEPSDTQARQP